MSPFHIQFPFVIDETYHAKRKRIELAELRAEIKERKRIARENELAARLFKSLLEMSNDNNDNHVAVLVIWLVVQ